MFVMLKYLSDDWPEDKPFRVEAHFSGEIPMSPTEARRRVAQFLAAQVRLEAFAGTPVLLLGDRLVWRVPACLRLPGLGDEEVVHLGVIDIDVFRGEMIVPAPEQVSKMQKRANALAVKFGTRPLTE
jgi:hypothetical protein